MAQVIHLNGSGAHGHYGMDGAHGEDGQRGWLSLDGANGSDGQDALLPTPGADGKDMSITLTTALSDENRLAVQITSKFFGHENAASLAVPMEELGGICWEARGGMGGHGGSGGNGGNGSDGGTGTDATEFVEGGNGGRGGNGGNGGYGTSGANGGRGGNVEFVVSEKDTYLLMAVACSNNYLDALQLVGGGPGGFPGCHGAGGRGGAGGPGGHSFTYEVRRGVHDHATGKDVFIIEQKTTKGGNSGRNGRNGITPTEPLHPGLTGANGSFKICCIEDDGLLRSYSTRYDLSLVGFEVMHAHFEGDPMMVEFGDTVTLHEISVRNEGSMPSPSSQRVMIELVDSGEPLIRPLSEHRVFLPRGNPLTHGDTGYTEGELCFFVPIPNARDLGDDFDRVVRKGGLCLKATQLGPELKGAEAENAIFKFPYGNFQCPGSWIVTATFPVENSHGVIGLCSMGAGETTAIKFDLKNIGSKILGGETRSLSVEFYLQPLTENSVQPGELDYELDDGETIELSACGKNVVIDIPLLEPGQEIMLSHKLGFSDEVQPYQRVALTAEIVLQDLRGDVDSSVDHAAASVVQRRTLDVVSEPSYARVKDSEAILITSTSTNGQVYRDLLDVLKTKMGISAEVYPVSRYGSLEAEFCVPPSNTTLAEVFRGKIVIILNQEFMLSGRDGGAVRPSELLPSGCLPECSGFHGSTRWIFLDSDDGCQNKLLNVHSSCVPTSVDIVQQEHENVASFYKSIESSIREEHALPPCRSGTHSFRRDTIHVRASGFGGNGEKNVNRRLAKLDREAQAICKWLSIRDPLHQCTVDYEPFSRQEASNQKDDNFIGRIFVRRGAFRPLNSAIMVQDLQASEAFDDPKSVTSKAVLFAIALGLSADLRVSVFCRAIERSTCGSHRQVLDALKDAFVSEFLRDAANVLDRKRMLGSDHLREQVKQLLPTLLALKENINLNELLERTRNDSGLLLQCSKELSKLLASLECVANSKDLRPLWLPFSFKHKLRPLLIDAVKALEDAWQHVVDVELKSKTKLELESAVRHYIIKERGKFRVSTHQRWRKGLNYLHSTNNAEKYSDSPLHVCRLLECSSVIDGNKQPQLSMRVPLPEKKVLGLEEVTRMRSMYHMAAEHAAKSKRQITMNRKALLVTHESI